MASPGISRICAPRWPWPALLLAMALWCMAAWWPAAAQQARIPELREQVTDTTGTLDVATVRRLTQALAGLEQSKGAQVAVLMVPTTEGESIESYAQRAFEQWKPGRAGVDDGILFVIAKDDRRLRIEVGYGLEGAVTDLQAGRIIRERVAPRFQQGDFAGGVEAGVQSLVQLVEGEELPAPSVAQTDPSSSSGFAFDWLWLIVFALLALPPLAAAGSSAVLLYVLTGSAVAAVVGGMAAFLITLAGRAAGAGPSRASRRGGVAGGHRPSSRIGWGGGGGGGFRSGGGGFRGGGGRSGGGGASGGW